MWKSNENFWILKPHIWYSGKLKSFWISAPLKLKETHLKNREIRTLNFRAKMFNIWLTFEQFRKSCAINYVFILQLVKGDFALLNFVYLSVSHVMGKAAMISCFHHSWNHCGLIMLRQEKKKFNFSTITLCVSRLKVDVALASQAWISRALRSLGLRV